MLENCGRVLTQRNPCCAVGSQSLGLEESEIANINGPVSIRGQRLRFHIGEQYFCLQCKMQWRNFLWAGSLTVCVITAERGCCFKRAQRTVSDSHLVCVGLLPKIGHHRISRLQGIGDAKCEVTRLLWKSVRQACCKPVNQPFKFFSHSFRMLDVPQKMGFGSSFRSLSTKLRFKHSSLGVFPHAAGHAAAKSRDFHPWMEMGQSQLFRLTWSASRANGTRPLLPSLVVTYQQNRRESKQVPNPSAACWTGSGYWS